MNGDAEHAAERDQGIERDESDRSDHETDRSESQDAEDGERDRLLS